MKTLMPAYRIAICSQRVFCHIQESKLIRAQATFGKHILLEKPVVKCTGFILQRFSYVFTYQLYTFLHRLIRVIAVQNLPPATQPLI